ncbi:unnamed protein product [Adineta ricciae]|uniref:PID domain-containing protein n=1 Tax=Adineta ricciae TaxID=249248 RepID=A0A814N730_ADIRI|nr:unnamed protein product [Adineta ricciae]
MSEATATTNGVKNKFDGDGVVFKGKLIGMEDVSVDRDEKVCLDSMFKLKAVVRARGEHKQRIQLNLTMNGVKVYDDTSKTQIASHEVERVSFVVLDPRDQRAFGYVYNTSDDRHQFWAIKTERQAATTVLALKDLFETAFEEFTKAEKEKVKATPEAAPAPIPVAEQPSLISTSSPTTPSPQVTAPKAPETDSMWGDLTSPAAPSLAPAPQQVQQQSTPNIDLWDASEPNLTGGQPAQSSSDDMFGLLVSPTPSIPAVNQSTPAAASPADDLFSMFAPAAPAPTVNNTAIARPPPQQPAIIPQQPRMQQPNLPYATPFPGIVPQQQNLLFSQPAPAIPRQPPPPLPQQNLLFAAPTPFAAPQQLPQQNLLFSQPAPAVAQQPPLLQQQQPSLLFSQPAPAVPQQPPLPQQQEQPSLLLATPAPATVPPPATKTVDEFDLLADFA